MTSKTPETIAGRIAEARTQWEDPKRFDERTPLRLHPKFPHDLLVSTLAQNLGARGYPDEIRIQTDKDQVTWFTGGTVRARRLLRTLMREPEYEALHRASMSPEISRPSLSEYWGEETDKRVEAYAWRKKVERYDSRLKGALDSEVLEISGYKDIALNELSYLDEQGIVPLADPEVAEMISVLVERELPFYLWETPDKATK